MRYLKAFVAVILVVFLTALTQVGGVVFLVSLIFYRIINRRFSRAYARILLKAAAFLLLYLLSVFFVVPLLAKPFGRVPMPLRTKDHVRPANVLTYFFCRNYVRPALRDVVDQVAANLNKRYPGTVINYLDAGFPFINRFPLPPHLSHYDGKKLDLSFFYVDSTTGLPTSEVPSWIGYGICEEPRAGEQNMPAYCASQGAWQYSLLYEAINQANAKGFRFDGDRTRAMVNIFANQPVIGRMYIEPHLKSRLGLTSKKIRFHGCQAVRHDDHLHVQIK